MQNILSDAIVISNKQIAFRDHTYNWYRAIFELFSPTPQLRFAQTVQSCCSIFGPFLPQPRAPLAIAVILVVWPPWAGEVC